MEDDRFHGPYLSDKILEAVFHGQAVRTVAYLRVSTAQQDVCSGVSSGRPDSLSSGESRDLRISSNGAGSVHICPMDAPLWAACGPLEINPAQPLLERCGRWRA